MCGSVWCTLCFAENSRQWYAMESVFTNYLPPAILVKSLSCSLAETGAWTLPVTEVTAAENLLGFRSKVTLWPSFVDRVSWVLHN